MNKKDSVYKILDEDNVKYEVLLHKAVYTIAEMEALDVDFKGANIVKNLFLKNSNGKSHYLIVMDKKKQANLKDLKNKLNSSALGFASENRLEKYLGLKKGAVSPFGILNDDSNSVELIIDSDLKMDDIVGVHPNDNTATVLILMCDLIKVIEKEANSIRYVDL